MNRPPDPLPPSAKLVYVVLQNATESMGWPALRQQTGLPESTLSEALDRLETEQLVQSKPNPNECGNRIYELHSGNRSEAEG